MSEEGYVDNYLFAIVLYDYYDSPLLATRKIARLESFVVFLNLLFAEFTLGTLTLIHEDIIRKLHCILKPKYLNHVWNSPGRNVK